MRYITPTLSIKAASLHVTVALLALVFATTGCKKPRQFTRTKVQQEKVDQALLPSVPAPKFPVGAILDDKVKLVGLDVEPEKPDPGAKITVHFYWEVLADVEDKGEWMIFVHLEGPVQGGGEQARVIADHHAVEDGPGGPGLFPMRDWKKGNIIKDTKTIDLVDPRGKKLGPGEMVIYMGVYDAEAYRSKQENIRMKVKGDGVKSDGGDRVEAARFMVGNAPPPPVAKPFSAPQLQARQAVGPITVDGKLDEPTWKAAVPNGPLGRPDGTPSTPDMKTTVRVLWDEQNLYIAFNVKDAVGTSMFAARDEELWKQDVVEVYLDPDADGKQYIELQVSPKNIIFDALFAERRKPDWPEAKKWNFANMKTAVATQTADGGLDAGWNVEIAIPWTDLADAKGAKPAIGGKWRANFFRIENKDKGQDFASWSAVAEGGGSDFHNLDRAGWIVFTETPPLVKEQLLAPKPVAPPVPAPPAVPPATGATAPTGAPEPKPAPKEGEGAAVDPAEPKKGDGAPAPTGAATKTDPPTAKIAPTPSPAAP